jgi:hypothetical protein
MEVLVTSQLNSRRLVQRANRRRKSPHPAIINAAASTANPSPFSAGIAGKLAARTAGALVATTRWPSPARVLR